MLANDGCLVQGSMRKARSLSNGDAYSAVRITVAASTASRLVKAMATGAAISHTPACTPVAAAAVPSRAVPSLRCRVDSGAAHMQSGSALDARVREGFRTGPDEAAGSRRHGTVIGGGGVSGGVGRVGYGRPGVWDRRLCCDAAGRAARLSGFR
jgi:hypothetical protein